MIDVVAFDIYGTLIDTQAVPGDLRPGCVAIPAHRSIPGA